MGRQCEEIELGDRAKDDVTGYEGIVVSITRWLHGCDRIGVQRPIKKNESKIEDIYTFDRMQMSLVKKNIVQATRRINDDLSNVGLTGGPTPNATPRPQTKY